MSETEIIHFGVKGMKWGVRKSESSIAKSEKARTPEEIARQKRIVRNVTIGAAVLAAAGLAIYGGVQVKNYQNVLKDVNLEYNATRFTHKIANLSKAKIDTGAEFAKGFQFTRFSTNQETEMIGRTFALSKVGQQSVQKGFGQWEHTIETSDLLKVAGVREQISAVSKHLRDVPTAKGNIESALKVKGLGGKLAKPIAEKKLAEIKLAEITTKWWKNEAAVKLIDGLKNDGFGGAWDVWDEGHANILFDPSKLIYKTIKSQYD